MGRIYTAANTTEAHLIKNLLESRGIEARVDGHYLQGGLGELPPVDLFSVRVSEEQEAAARAVVEEWEQSEGRVDEETLTRLALETRAAPPPSEEHDAEARLEASDRIMRYLLNLFVLLLLGAATALVVHLAGGW